MSGAVFLSYASQDAEAAKRVCESLRAAGVEVWFDADGGLEHGDEWDAKIRRQIKECVLFLPIISAHTQARPEGYFRIEWDLAAERAQGIASGVPFILPIVIDDTHEPEALVPDRFRKVQWMRLPGGAVSAEVQARFLKLWSHRTGVLSHEAAASALPPPRPVVAAARPGWRAYALTAAAAVLVLAAGGWWLRVRSATPSSNAHAAAQPLSPARQLAKRAYDLSAGSFDSTLDDYKAAEGLIKQALDLDPNDGEIWAISSQINFGYGNRGYDYSTERVAAARAQAEHALKLVPDSPEALYALGVLQTHTSGMHALGIQNLRRAAALAPQHGRAQLFLGSALQADGNLEESLLFFNRARQEPQWAPLADYFLFLRHFHDGDFPGADDAIRSSIAGRPSVNSFSAQAMLHITWKGDLDNALADLAKAPPAFSAEHRIIWITAQIQMERRSPDEALRVLDQLADNFIHDSWFIGPKDFLVGCAQAEAGRMEAAQIAWKSGLAVIDDRLQTAPGDTSFHLIRGELLGRLGREQDALAEARNVEELYRDQVYPWFLSPVRIYAAIGRSDLAVPMLQRLLGQLGRSSDFNVNWPLTRTLLRLDPIWDKLRGDPGFQALLAESPISDPKK